MPISKIKSSSITADAASTNLNIDAGTLFLDTTNNRVGVGHTSPGASLDVRTSTATSYTGLFYNTSATGQGVTVRAGSTASQDTFNCQTYDGNILLFKVGADGKVGIGETSPTQILHLKGSSTAYGLAETTGTGASSGFRMKAGGSADYTLFTTQGINQFAIYNNAASTQPLTITSAGNVGIGKSSPAATLDIVGPSAGASPYLSKSIQFAPSNFPDRTWSLNYDDSGSAGNGFNISSQSTKILYLNGNGTGKVGIGTVSPVAQLDIENSSVQPFGTAAQLNAIFKGSVSIGQGGAIGFDYFGSHTNCPTSMGYAIESQAESTKGSLVFGTRSATTDTAPTERMRINSDGEVLIGATAQGRETNLAVVGSYQDPTGAWAQVGIYSNDAFAINKGGTLMFGGQDGLNVRSYFAAIKGAKATSTDSDYSGYMSFFTRPVGDVPAERARFTSGGNFLVGGTTIDTGFAVVKGVTYGESYIRMNHPLNTPNGYGYADFTYHTGMIGNIAQSGTTAVSYNTTSDYRLKNTIAPMTGALAKVALLKPCTYKWNADGSDGQGFIAHELAEVVPQCVSGEKDAVNTDGSIKSQGIDTSFLVATLTAAIQEQQTLITQLTERIAALENK